VSGGGAGEAASVRGPRVAALVPVRRLGVGKSRLRPPLDPSASAALARAMLEDVLAALAATRGVAERAVVTDDPAVAEVAAGAGARVVRHPEEGLSPSVDAGAAALAGSGAEGVLIVLGDVAGALPEDLEALVRALGSLGGRGAVLAPARDGGSSALLRAPHDVLPSRFGPESAARHREAARRAGVPFRELDLPSLRIDVDDTEDLELLLRDRSARGRRSAPRTREVLRQLGWRGAA